MSETTVLDGRKLNAFTRMYRGLTSIDFVGRRKVWFAVSAIVILAGAVSLGVRGLNLGIDFKGGNSWQVTAKNVSQTQAVNAVTAVGLNQPVVYILAGVTINVEADLNSLSLDAQRAESTKVRQALATLAHTTPDQVSSNTVGPTWGGQVTKRALWALLAFFIAVLIYISARFEPIWPSPPLLQWCTTSWSLSGCTPYSVFKSPRTR